MTESSPNSVPPPEFLYYFMDDLEAVRDRRWRLHLPKWGQPLHQLYDLLADPGEAHDVAARHPEVVKELRARATRARRSLGDAASGSWATTSGRSDGSTTPRR